METDFMGAAFEEASAQTPLQTGPASNDNEIDTTEIVSKMADPLHQAFEENAVNQDQQTAIALDQLRTQNPDQYAEAMKQADLTQLPVDTIYRNIDQFKDRDKLEAAREVLSSNPSINEWFSQGDNRKLLDAPDLSRLSGIRWLTRGASESFDKGQRGTRMMELAFSDMFNAASDEDKLELTRLQAIKPQETGPASYAAQAVFAGFEQLPILGKMLKTTAEFGLAGAASGLALGATLGAGTPAEAVTIPATALATGVGTARVGMAFESFRLNAGEAYLDYRGMRDANGRAMDNDTVRGAALLSGSINAGLDVIGLSALAKTLPGFDQIKKIGTKAAVKELLAKEAFRDVAKRVGKRFAEGVAVETFTEMMQELVKIVSGEGAKLVENKTRGKEFEAKPLDESAEQILDTGKQALLATVFLAGATSVSTLGYDTMRAGRAKGDKTILDTLAAGAADDALVKRSPVKAAEAVNAAVEGTGKETIHIPADKVVSLLQDDTWARAFSAVPNIQGAINEALATGNPVAIPTGDFYAHIMPNKEAAGLTDFLKFEMDGHSFKEAADMMERVVKAKEAWEKSEKDMETLVKGPVYLDISKKAKGLGFNAEQAHHYAALYESFFNTMAVASNTPVEQLYRQYEIQMMNEETYKETDSKSLLQSTYTQKATGAEIEARIGDVAIGDYTLKGRNDSGFLSYELVDKKGKVVGSVDLNHRDPVGPRADIYLGESSRGKGLGPKMYAAIEKNLGIKLTPNDEISGNALGLWRKFRPEAVADYQSIGVQEETGYEYFAKPRELKQKGGKLVRGSIELGDKKAIIKLFKYQNMSTFLHESGHLFLHVMSEVVKGDNVSNQLKVDYKTLQDYLGEQGPDFSVEAHEKFARSFEAYLFEGRAPTQELERPFAAFKSWLKAVYRRVSNLNVSLSDNVKGVFDRMLIGDQAIDEYQRLHGLSPAFQTAEQAGMSEEAFGAYVAKLGAIREIAKRELEKKMLGDAALAMKKENVAAKAKIKAEVEEDFGGRPVYRAMRWLRGQTPIAGMDPVKLDRREVVKILGKGNLKTIVGGSQMWALPKDDQLFTTAAGEVFKFDLLGSQGEKRAKSHQTVYVTEAVAEKLKADQRAFVIEDGQIKRRYESGRHKGKIEKKTATDFSKQPAVGLVPVEIDKAGVPTYISKIANVGTDKEVVQHPDVVAQMFGFESGADMLSEFQRAKPFNEAVAEEVKARMEPILEEQLKTTAQIRQQAAVEMKNSMYQDFLISEIKAIHGLLGVDFDEKQVRAFPEAARQLVRGKKFKTVVGRDFVKQYTNADRQLNSLIAEAVEAQDFSEVTGLRLKQLFNSYLTEEAAKAQKEAKSVTTWVKKYAKKSAKNIDQGYLSQIRGILISYGFIKGQIDETAVPFSQFLDDEIASYSPIVADPALRSKPTAPFSELTVDEVSAIRNTISNLDTVGRNKKNLLKAGKKFDLAAAVASIVAETQANLRAPKQSLNFNPSWLETKMAGARGFFVTSLLKVEQMCDWMDGGAVNGPAHKFIFQPVADAQVLEQNLMKDYGAKILDIVERKPRSYWQERQIIDAIGGKAMKREEIIAVALNLGNASNRERLMAGQGWKAEQIEAITNTLTKEDWDTVQEIWNLVDSLWPMVRETATKIGMAMPDKVEPSVVDTPHGQYAGGYYPVMYDPRKTAEIQRRQMASKAEEMFGVELHTLFPTAGFAKDRTSSFAAPLLLDFSVLPTHVSRVLHWVTHAEAVEGVSKVIRNKDFAATANKYFGEGIIPTLDGWLNNISRGEQGVKGLTDWEGFFGGLRRSVTLMGLGLRATTALMQAGGLLSGSEMIGGRHVARGAMALFSSGSMAEISKNLETIRQKSGEMKHRTQFLERDLRDVSVAMSTAEVYHKKIRDIAMVPITIADNIFSMSVWQGAYLKALEAKQTENDAIKYADKVVRLTQGTGAAKDLAAVQRGGEFMRFMTMFYTYFSSMQNRLMDIASSSTGQQNYKGLDRPNNVMRWVYMSVLPSLLLDTLLRGWLKGDYEKKDKEELAKDAALRLIAYQFAGVPFVRDGVSYITRSEDHFDYAYSPVVTAIQRTAKSWDDVIQAAFRSDKDLTAKKVLNAVNYTAGYGIGLPMDVLATPLHNAIKAEEDGSSLTLTDMFIRR